MRELTIHELDAELAEQLPARELMGRAGRLIKLIHIIDATSVAQASSVLTADHSIVLLSGNSIAISVAINL
jgi:hypothetical protein